VVTLNWLDFSLSPLVHNASILEGFQNPHFLFYLCDNFSMKTPILKVKSSHRLQKLLLAFILIPSFFLPFSAQAKDIDDEQAIIDKWMDQQNQGVPQKVKALFHTTFPEGCELDSQMNKLDVSKGAEYGIPAFAQYRWLFGKDKLALHQLSSLALHGKTWFTAEYENRVGKGSEGDIAKLFFQDKSGVKQVLDYSYADCRMSLLNLGSQTPMFAAIHYSRHWEISDVVIIYQLNEKSKPKKMLELGGWFGQVTCVDLDHNGTHQLMSRIKIEFSNDLKAKLKNLADDADSNFLLFRYDIYEWRDNQFKLLCHYYGLTPTA
jgi:hypothetical protein